MTDVLEAECPKCGRMSKALAHCKYCDEFVPMTLELTPAQRSAAAFPADYRRVLEESSLPIEVATAIADRIDKLVEATRRVVDASDQFIRDTGLKHGDLITDAVDAARPLVGRGSATHSPTKGA